MQFLGKRTSLGSIVILPPESFAIDRDRLLHSAPRLQMQLACSLNPMDSKPHTASSRIYASTQEQDYLHGSAGDLLSPIHMAGRRIVEG